MFWCPTAVRTCAGWLTPGESQLWWLFRHVEHRSDACVTKEQTGINGGADGMEGGSCVPPSLSFISCFCEDSDQYGVGSVKLHVHDVRDLKSTLVIIKGQFQYSRLISDSAPEVCLPPIFLSSSELLSFTFSAQSLFFFPHLLPFSHPPSWNPVAVHQHQYKT